jgi:hypothetical protein
MRSIVLVSLLAACSNAADPVQPDAPTSMIDAPSGPPLDILRVNEVVAAGAPDWIEVINVSSAPVELSEYCYVDVAGDFAKCKPFPAMQLAPDAHFAQDVDDPISGFKLGGDEEIWIYRIADSRVSDSLDWAEGDSPANESFARIPDKTGTFQKTNVVTKATANMAANPNAPLGILVINEVAADEAPDWLEIVNASNATVNLQDFCYIDSGAIANCKPFPTMTLAPGAYFAADASTAISNFAFGGDESAAVYRIADQRLSDMVDWPANGAGPMGSSYARSPNVTGAFATVTTQTKGAANP